MASGDGIRITAGLAWTGAAQAWNVALLLGSAIVLARLLTPDDYGVQAAIVPIIGIAGLLQAQGFAAAIMQARAIDKQQLNTLFWISFAISVVLAAAIALFAPMLAGIFGEPRLADALRVSSVAVVLTAVAAQPATILSRELRFRTMALRNVVAATASAAATIALAAWLRDYWALVINLILTPALVLILSASAVRWLPGRPGSIADARALLGFGRRVWGSSLAAHLARQFDYLIIARSASSRDLGLYDRANRLILSPLTLAVPPVGQVMIPALSRQIDDAKGYRSTYWRTVGWLLLACQPGLLFAMLFPIPIIAILLGPQWLDAARMFGWFAAAGLAQVVLPSVNWLLVSQGRARELMVVNITNSAVSLAAFLIGIRWGVEGVAMALAISQVAVCLPFALLIAGRSGHVRHGGMARLLAPHLAAMLAVAGLLEALGRITADQPGRMALTGLFALAYCLYAAVLVAFPGSRQMLSGQAEGQMEQ